MPSFFQVRSFVDYWLDAVDEHSLHSPFFFDLYTKIVNAPSEPSDFKDFEMLRQRLLKNEQVLNIDDLGAGSAVHTGTRKVKDIAHTSLSRAKYLQLYDRIIRNYQAKNIVELGTCLGISTLYLENKSRDVVTFEGVPEIASIARDTFEFAQTENIRLIEGNIDTTLPNYLLTSKKLDIAFIDANHRYEPTKRYFSLLLQKTHSRSVIILDDIHYSPEMEAAWAEIRANKLVYGTVDLYRCGLVFFDPSLNHQNVVLQF